MLFVDIESFVEQVDDTRKLHTFRMAWVCYWRIREDKTNDTQKYTFFEDVDKLWDYIDSKPLNRQPCILTSHNVAYDFGNLGIFDALGNRGWELKSLYTKGLVSILRWQKGEKKLILLDNSNFFPGKLANLGEAVGYPKDDVDPLTATQEELKPYCKRDVEILVKLWEWYFEFLEAHDLGSWGPTLSSQAFHAYRHRFMPYSIWMHNNESVLAMEREAYKGGRTSVFWRGLRSDGPFYHLDVNSMYPGVMHGNLYPVKWTGFRSRLTVDGLRRAIRGCSVVARVRLKTDIPVYPVNSGGHNVYPVGEFDTTLTTPEIAFAFERHQIIKVYDVATYEQALIFDDYVDTFYKLKAHYKQTDIKPFYLMVKLYLNSLYGKFAQRKEVWEQILDCPDHWLDVRTDYNLDTGKVTPLYHFGDTTWTTYDDGESYNAFPLISAHVTAYARLKLWDLREKAGAANFYYVDTDGFIVNETGKDNLLDEMHPDRLGALKTEKVSGEIEILAPKYYRQGDNWKRKGVNEKALELEPHVYECEQFPGLRGIGRALPGTPYYSKSVVKRFGLKIYDGHVKADGWVTPFQAKEIIAKRKLTPHQEDRLYRLDTQIETLQEARTLPHRLVFKMWNYNTSTWKQGRDKSGNLVPIEYSQADTWASEQGLPDLEALQGAVMQQVDIDRKIRKLQDRRYKLLSKD